MNLPQNKILLIIYALHYYKIMGKKVECFKLSFDFFGVRIPIYFSGVINHLSLQLLGFF